MTTSPEVRAGDLLAGRYELLRHLGAGGMSRVFLARDRELDRSVAVKLMHGDVDGDDLGRLRDEARAAAAIEHPGVVTVYDVGSSQAGLHVVMSYVEGESLAQRLDRDGPLSPATVAGIGVAVCDALGAAHRAGVVHRDVAPGNIMLRPDGGVIVTDFGIARVGDGAGRTATGHIVGTPAYIAPEQGRGGTRLDGRTDLYALGCCLFAALTGRPPFTDPDPMTVVLAHIRDSPPRPSTLRGGIPPRLERTLLRALAKDPELRYRDAAEMASDLTAAAPGCETTVSDDEARTRKLPSSGGPDATLDLPEQRERREPLDRALADAGGPDGVVSDRRRTAGMVLLILAAVLALGVLVAVLLLG